MWLKKVMGRRLRVVHVAHNTFTDLKRQSLFPDTIIAVSHGVKENLVSYFGVPEERVHVIYNGVDDAYDPQTAVSRMRDGIIRVLLPGRVCPVKQQLKIVEACMGRLSAHVHIDFAGEGEDLPRLRQLTSGSRQFHCLGLVDLKNYLPHYDYVMLFSQKEGLPLSLIRGGVFCKPQITNNLSVLREINEDKVTGFVFADFDSLVDGLNHLPDPDSEEYCRLAANARAKYERMFTVDRMITAYKQLLSNIE